MLSTAVDSRPTQLPKKAILHSGQIIQQIFSSRSFTVSFFSHFPMGIRVGDPHNLFCPNGRRTVGY